MNDENKSIICHYLINELFSILTHKCGNFVIQASNKKGQMQKELLKQNK